MSGTQYEDPDALAAAEQERLAAEAAGGDQHDDGEGAEGGEQRRPRPGKLERRLARTEGELDAARRQAQAAEQRWRESERRLAEATEAGNKLTVRSINTELASAEAALREAIVNNDPDAIVKAQRQVSEVVAAGHAYRTAPRPAPPPEQAAPQTFTPTTQAWLAANPWYGQDEELTSIARATHAAALRKGFAVDTPAYWKAVEDGVEALAPGTVRRPGGDPDDDEPARTPTPRAPGGQGVTRSPPRTPGAPAGTVRLTPEEADAAKITGLTPQEYRQHQILLRQQGKLGARQ